LTTKEKRSRKSVKQFSHIHR